MGRIRVACQTYTWEMLGNRWKGGVADILDSVASAGYDGIEITNNMIGEFAGRPGEFSGELRKRGLELAAYAYARTGFSDPRERAEDIAGAQRAIEFVRRFAEPRLGLGGAANACAQGGNEKLDRAIGFYNQVGKIGAAAGVSVNVHPHSHHGSLIESAISAWLPPVAGAWHSLRLT